MQEAERFIRRRLALLLGAIKAPWWSARSAKIVERLHKPLLRNLEEYNATEILLAIYAYAQYLQFDVQLPPFLAYPALQSKAPRLTGLTEWELDVLSREAIAYSNELGGRPVASYSDISTAMNLIKRVEENIWRAYPHGQRDIIWELSRIAHRQFPWQRPINHPAIGRYFKVYKDPHVEDVLRRVTGLSATDPFRVGVGLTGHFLERPTLPIPTPAAVGVPSALVDAFLRRFATTFSDLRERIRASNSFGVNWAYVPNPLRDWPLIAGKGAAGYCYLCPIPSFLLQRLTSGIYYELIADNAFGNPFGASFQRYIGEVLERSNRGVERYTIFPERKYGPASLRKDTVDWIVQDAAANLFIEVKTKRLAVQAKVDLESRNAIDAQLAKMAEFVVQIYRTLSDALAGKYPEWKPNGLPIYPLVVTLEECSHRDLSFTASSENAFDSWWKRLDWT